MKAKVLFIWMKDMQNKSIILNLNSGHSSLLQGAGGAATRVTLNHSLASLSSTPAAALDNTEPDA